MTEGQQQDQPKFRRKMPCVNHSVVAAVAYCQVCGNPICKTCIGYYGGAHICSADCWTRKISEESKTIFSRVSHKSKRREKFAAISGFTALAGLVLGVSVFLAMPRFTDHRGERLWEIQYSPSCFEYAVNASADVLLLLQEDTVQAYDAANGTKRWHARLPEDHEGCKALVIDKDRSVLYYADRVLLVRSDRTVPVWEYVLPQPHLAAAPVVANETLFLACLPGPPESIAPSASHLQKKELVAPAEGERQRRRGTSICAIDIMSGAEVWRAILDDVAATELIADSGNVYVAGSVFNPPTELSKQKKPAAIEEADARGVLISLRSNTGSVEWKTELEKHYLRPKLTAHGFAAAGRDFLSFISQNGTITWRYPLDGHPVHFIESLDTHIFVSIGDGLLASIDAFSGRRNWVIDVDCKTERLHASSPNVCICGSEMTGKGISLKTTPHADSALSGASGATDAGGKRLLCGMNIETGEVRVSRTIFGTADFFHAFLFTISVQAGQNVESSREPPQGGEQESIFSAYSCANGEKMWDIHLDGIATELAFTDSVAIVKVVSNEEVITKKPVQSDASRLIGFSLR